MVKPSSYFLTYPLQGLLIPSVFVTRGLDMDRVSEVEWSWILYSVFELEWWESTHWIFWSAFELVWLESTNKFWEEPRMLLK